MKKARKVEKMRRRKGMEGVCAKVGETDVEEEKNKKNGWKEFMQKKQKRGE